ncbi:MAG: hypothetical protein LBR91_00990 [Puniceicoccales bacterium]|nr:hypothetical protein [Puniceicoccales bacterium]
MKKCVIFVCSGNTCRSPMAEYLLKSAVRKAGIADKFNIGSVGIATSEKFPATTLAINAMKDFSPDISNHSTRLATQKIFDSADVIFCLTEEHKKFVLSNFKKVEKKSFLLKEFLNCENKDIADPFFGNSKDYERVRDEINSAMDSILKFLTDWNET